MRQAFEAWAQRDGHIVRRREDKPEEYLVYETQRRWLIWQAALAHGQKAAAEALQAVRDELGRYNNFASSVAGVTSTQAIKALADVISGQIVGVGLSSRANTASAGATVRY